MAVPRGTARPWSASCAQPTHELRPTGERGALTAARRALALGAQVYIIGLIVLTLQIGQVSRFIVNGGCDGFVDQFQLMVRMGLLEPLDAECFYIAASIESGCWMLVWASVYLNVASQIVQQTARACVTDRLAVAVAHEKAAPLFLRTSRAVNHRSSRVISRQADRISRLTRVGSVKEEPAEDTTKDPATCKSCCLSRLWCYQLPPTDDLEVPPWAAVGPRGLTDERNAGQSMYSSTSSAWAGEAPQGGRHGSSGSESVVHNERASFMNNLLNVGGGADHRTRTLSRVSFAGIKDKNPGSYTNLELEADKGSPAKSPPDLHRPKSGNELRGRAASGHSRISILSRVKVDGTPVELATLTESQELSAYV